MVEGNDRAIEQIARELRGTPVEPVDPGFDARVMAAVRSEPLPVRRRAGVFRRSASWLVQPRTVSVTPLAGLLVAATVLLAVVMLPSWRNSGEGGALRNETSATASVGSGGVNTVVPAPGAAASGAESPGRVVQFVLLAPRASTVSLVGDFNDWDTSATPLERVGTDGQLWTVGLPLRPGRYTYTFVVDGEEWVADPSAPRALTDDFGRPNSVVTVGESSS